MRFLILSAFVACVAAAPSGSLTPVVGSLVTPAVAPVAPIVTPVAPIVPPVARIVPPLAPIAAHVAPIAVSATPIVAPVAPIVAPVATVYAAAPTISPGDIEAAAIDEQVKIQDAAIAAADKARELSELATENLNEKVDASNDQAKENVEEQFWSVEERKWQALDALKTAEAQIDGSVVTNAGKLAKRDVIPHTYNSDYSRRLLIYGHTDETEEGEVEEKRELGEALKTAKAKRDVDGPIPNLFSPGMDGSGVPQVPSSVVQSLFGGQAVKTAEAEETPPEKTEILEALAKSVEPVVDQVIAPFGALG